MKSNKRTHFGFSFQNEKQKTTENVLEFEQKTSQWFGKKSLETSFKFATSQYNK